MQDWKRLVAVPLAATLVVSGLTAPTAGADAKFGEGSGSNALSKRCTAALTGWGAAGALLIPVGILAQMGNTTVLTVFGVIRYIIQQATAVLKLRVGEVSPALGEQVDNFGALSSEKGSTVAALALGTLAVATTASACGENAGSSK